LKTLRNDLQFAVVILSTKSAELTIHFFKSYMRDDVLRYLYDIFLNSTGVNTDTRTVQEGQIYFALRGDRFDGNDYIDLAFERGASHVVVDSPWISPSSRIIKVPDTYECLQTLANHHRKQMSTLVIGLTGSNGKTTTKELIHSVLSQAFNVLATEGNLNNHIGLPLTLLKLDNSYSHAVIEMGASSVREIDFLSRIAEPTIGYITNYGKAHLEGFGSEQGIIQGKSELYDFLRETGGLSVVNADDAMQMKKSANMNRITFGSSKADFVIKKLDNSEDEFLHVLFNKKIIKSQLTGAYNFPNIFAAITIGKYLGMTDEDVALGISQYVPQNNRSEIRQIKTNTVILDAYNANPTSVEMALRALAARKGYKVAILGDMFELGRFALEEHYRMLSLARELGINRIITVGELYMEVFSGRGVEQYITTQECMDGLSLGKPLRKATILIKGSRGMRLEQLLDFLNT